ncbi:GNAT family N-acetyltransferase [Virgibacillus sp. 7505]|uniref:GNAT family N-acetyltransferase n=1 Tax=Virgibacillus sp. 7505 TaxID=2022548 RepID=UPI0015958603|nr:GNAT family N-acetyltransferase [Virgibacillus sp. 7505]
MCKNIMFAERKQTGLHPFNEQSKTALAALFHKGFRNTIDAEYDSMSAYLGEIQAVIDGKYGEFLPSCSYFSQTAEGINGVTMVTIYRSFPLLAYVVTAPEWQGKGVATNLIQYSEQGLGQQGYETFYLVVTKQNYRAISLYRTLGFREAGEDWDVMLRRRGEQK